MKRNNQRCVIEIKARLVRRKSGSQRRRDGWRLISPQGSAATHMQNESLAELAMKGNRAKYESAPIRGIARVSRASWRAHRPFLDVITFGQAFSRQYVGSNPPRSRRRASFVLALQRWIRVVVVARAEAGQHRVLATSKPWVPDNPEPREQRQFACHEPS